MIFFAVDLFFVLCDLLVLLLPYSCLTRAHILLRHLLFILFIILSEIAPYSRSSMAIYCDTYCNTLDMYRNISWCAASTGCIVTVLIDSNLMYFCCKHVLCFSLTFIYNFSFLSSVLPPVMNCSVFF